MYGFNTAVHSKPFTTAEWLYAYHPYIDNRETLTKKVIPRCVSNSKIQQKIESILYSAVLPQLLEVVKMGSIFESMATNDTTL
ncbi:hypothetical protein FRB91_009325, partial [Serendipita sp. 411]